MSTSRLLTLPRELRDIIYTELILSLRQNKTEISAEELTHLFYYRDFPRFGRGTALHKRPGRIAFLISHPRIFDEAWPLVLKNLAVYTDFDLLRIYSTSGGDKHFNKIKENCLSLVLDAEEWGLSLRVSDAIDDVATFPKLEHLDIRVDCTKLPEGLEIPRSQCVMHYFPMLKEIKVRDVVLERDLRKFVAKEDELNAMVNRAVPGSWRWILFEQERRLKNSELRRDGRKLLPPYLKLDGCDLRLKVQVEARRFRREHAPVCSCGARNAAGLSGRDTPRRLNLLNLR